MLQRKIATTTLALALLAGTAAADIPHEWLSQIPVGFSLGAGLTGMVVDAPGVSYVTGITGSSSNTDIVTAAFAPDGSLLWSHVFNGPQDWHDQAWDIALAPGGVIYVIGNTPGPTFHADVLLLKYDAASGSLLDVIQWASAPSRSEYGSSVRTNAQGDVFVLGGTVGDGTDALVVKFNANGVFQWMQTWDGPASVPYSLDRPVMIRIAPDGNPVVLIEGVMWSLHPDYVIVKYAAADGAMIWEANWGVNGGDFPIDMQIDAVGDVFVTGTGVQFNNKFSTLKLRGSDGQLLWQEYDSLGSRDLARALYLDGAGGVLITGSVDLDGDLSNFNDKFYTIKRDATDGSLLWTHVYGQSCVGCFDVPADIVAAPSGHVFVSGRTSSPPYSGDMITFVLDGSTGAELGRSVISLVSPEHIEAEVLRFDAAHNLFIGGEITNTNNNGTQITVTKYANLAYTSQNFCTTSPNSMGPGALIGASGSASVGENDFTLTVSAAAAGQFGVFFYGTDQVSLPFGDGVLCIGGGVFRLNPPLLTDGLGSASRWADLTAPPAGSGLGAITPGSSWNFQFWYRDGAAGGAQVNLSDGLAVVFLP